MKFRLPALITLSVLSACNNNQSVVIKGLLNEQNLASQFFTININTDTTLLTKNGCVIKIPKGAITSSNNNVKLEIKEALNTTDIVLAGLTTMSGKQPLSSGGMLYFNVASGYNIEIKKPIEVLIPTKDYNRDMQVFKGNTANGKIDWQQPESLPADATTTKVDTGKVLFLSNCASCHKVDRDFTGPALMGVTKRYTWKELYTITAYSSALLGFETPWADEYTFGISNDKLNAKEQIYFTKDEMVRLFLKYKCLDKKWGGNIMPSYSMLSKNDIKNIYAFIESEGEKIPKNYMKENYKDCCDSCGDYILANLGLLTKRENLKDDNGNFFTLEREIPMPPTAIANYKLDTTTLQQPSTKISSTSVSATYYTINIKATGWYNIDILMKGYSNCVESELFVRLQGSYDIDVNINLIIPQYKAFVEGGKLNDGKQYGFDETNGKLMLPQNAKAYIIAFAEKEDKIIFAKKEFNTQTKQTIELTFTEISKQQLKAEIMALKLDDVSAEVEDSKHANEIRAIDKKLKGAEKLKPKNCNCDDLIPQPKVDSVK